MVETLLAILVSIKCDVLVDPCASGGTVVNAEWSHKLRIKMHAFSLFSCTTYGGRSLHWLNASNDYKKIKKIKN